MRLWRIPESETTLEAPLKDAPKVTQCIELKGHTANIQSVEFSPDGFRIASASDVRLTPPRPAKNPLIRSSDDGVWLSPAI